MHNADHSTGTRLLLHEQDVFPGVVWPTLPPSFDFLTPFDIDASFEPLATEYYEIDFATVPWGGEAIVSTFQGARSPTAAGSRVTGPLSA